MKGIFGLFKKSEKKDEQIMKNEEENNNNKNCILNMLPNNIQILMFSFLPISDICKIQRVCRKWYILSQNSVLWKNLINNTEFKVWTNKKISDSSNSSILSTSSHINKNLSQKHVSEDSKEMMHSFKTFYLESKRKVPSKPQDPFQGFSAKKKNTPGTEKNISVFGCALNTNAKKLVYSLMWHKQTPVSITGMKAGNEGVGSGVSFSMCGKEFNLAALYTSHSGHEHNERLWGEALDSSCAFIFVMDNCSLLEKQETKSAVLESAKKEIEIYYEKLVGKPLLILAFELDLTEDEKLADEIIEQPLPETSLLPPSEIAKGLGFDSEEKNKLQELNVCIRTASIRNFSEVAKGLNWLIEQI